MEYLPITSFEKISKQLENLKDTLYVCDECKKDFKPTEVIVAAAENTQFSGLLNIKCFKHENKTYYMHCPHCKQSHLFGFDLKS